ncbi:uncharacterized protein SETTUDRAFT_163860 [Exserohilum turcica Et28A]|uniref:Uncharacterized protein n=1 Tax=Exserohilum turcicum (strain 28A) TaxID=671987 RepID=R0JW32_EXST2|nr:uncharacterized protein SETTUDRAFT_163860 [Exserohilum turcica Et28A]EOA85148.1 hypothetical protein SETTUDRAFT_163860 [Exserohilum turcica Et28A]
MVESAGFEATRCIDGLGLFAYRLSFLISAAGSVVIWQGGPESFVTPRNGEEPCIEGVKRA